MDSGTAIFFHYYVQGRESIFPLTLKFHTFSNIGRLLMEFSSWSVVKGDGAFHGLFVWDRVRMSDQKVVRFPAIFQIFRLFDHYV